MSVFPVKLLVRAKMDSGLPLGIAALLGLLAANSPFADSYRAFLTLPVVITVGSAEIGHDLRFWINDGLMTVFFFLIGLEVKRAYAHGTLAHREQAALPVLAALGGVIVPAAIFLAVNTAALNGEAPLVLRGWAVPTATDIAFALAILGLFRSRTASALKLFLMTLAIADDLIAVLIVAFFYTGTMELGPFAAILVGIGVLGLLHRFRISAAVPYILTGAVLWGALLAAGVHPTVAGVMTALAIPSDPHRHRRRALLTRMYEAVHDNVTFFVLPLFAFANAGLPLAAFADGALWNSVSLGVFLGLVIGKPLGVFSAALLALRSGLAVLPEHVTRHQLFACSLLAGIGFTMSLFIGGLAFGTGPLETASRGAVFAGSLVSALLGYLMLRRVLPKPVIVGRQTPSAE
ncbi:Na+/H+ antiporter NhaA [Nisaea acidiphila]|uniref:Na(+)/H(+) antiporter NhaA n=1 Tax=Nisaea acidiphila TaxID=1862145 RepID=A0A9J7ATV4_9PROT|nr:Na+/H+ antiporter NhaA [Nisaea acidiphila]UUX48813.1 Na+/H+ antiporter NhaA [Nisaea acidiphila]